MEVEFGIQFESYLALFEKKKEEFQQVKSEYFGLTDADFGNCEKCKNLEIKFDEAQKAYYIFACLLAEFVVQNREKIRVQ